MDRYAWRAVGIVAANPLRTSPGDEKMSDLLTTDVTNPWISRWRQLRSRLPKAATPVFFIVLVVLAANILLILGITNNDPISWTANIARSNCGFVCGRSMIDINVGMITQPLGHLAANNLLHGHLSWWNSFEGLGQPLVGEMQSAGALPTRRTLRTAYGFAVVSRGARDHCRRLDLFLGSATVDSGGDRRSCRHALCAERHLRVVG